MATAAQILANTANAQLSTGPKTAEGKARASRNNLQHGLTLGLLTLDPEEQSAFCEFEANFRAECKPDGLMETETLTQFVESAWRLRKIRAIVDKMILQYEADPFVHPDAEAQLRQLFRYRAAAEMAAFRAIRTFRELQTTRLCRALHITKEEQTVIPPLVRPGAKIMFGGALLNRTEREICYAIHGVETFLQRFSQVANQRPN